MSNPQLDANGVEYLGSLLFLTLSLCSLRHCNDVLRRRRPISWEEKLPKTATSSVVSASPNEPAKATGSEDGKSSKSSVKGPPAVLMPNVTIEHVKIYPLTQLSSVFPSANMPNINQCGNEYHQIIGHEDYILKDIVRKQGGKKSISAFVRAGPRSINHFNAKTVRAAIVTCGGLCPGLNCVVRELVKALVYLYDVEKIIGIRGGYNGFSNSDLYQPMDLDLDAVQHIHHEGGTLLSSSRGGFDVEKIISFLITNRINQLYVIGGDGTHRGANIIGEECIARGLNIAVAGIPKTIDNDIDLIDRSFGFTTSVEAAQAAISSAKTEAQCNLPNGIGIVKLMGRSSGFIAVHAALASGDVDLCLIPEVAIDLDVVGKFLRKRVKEQGHAVVVVAEGAGEELLGKSTQTDAGGNRKLPPIGDFLKDKITECFAKNGTPATVKYIDPSYMIRSVPANASDALMCMLLAQNAVHGAMAGYSNFTTGLVNNRVVYIPIPCLVATSPRVLDPDGRTWERLLSVTRQPQMPSNINPATQSVSGSTVV